MAVSKILVRDLGQCNSCQLTECSKRHSSDSCPAFDFSAGPPVELDKPAWVGWADKKFCLKLLQEKYRL